VNPARRGAALLLCAALLGVACALFDLRGVAPAFRSGDALEYALMARHLARGEGFTTNLIYPPALWLGIEAAPAVKYAPLWPLVLAGPFAAFGADASVARGVLVILFAALVTAAAALAAARGGLLAGAVAAVAVALSPEIRFFALDAVSETLFALAITLALLACARGASAFAVGLCCGLAYLTRYNGAVLLPALLPLVWARDRAVRTPVLCAAGFLAVALPWWMRNLLVTGDPFYSLLSLNLWVSPDPTPFGGSLFFQPEPDLGSAAAADPLAKLTGQLPFLLARLPLASANLAAFAGVLLGCLRRDLLCLAFAAICAASLVIAALALPLGRYLVPLLPASIALGAAAWTGHGGKLRVPALALLLLAPVLPRVPAPLPDVALVRATWEAERQADVQALPVRETPDALRACLAGRPAVIAEKAPRLAWDTDAIAIFSPLRPRDFWRIVEEQPVAFAQRRDLGPLEAERFAAEFAPRPDCGPGFYERRARSQ